MPSSIPTAYDIATVLLECTRTKVAETTAGVPAKMRLAVVTGETIAFDDCCNGQLTVAISQTFPSSTFPEVDESYSRCGGAAWAAVFNITVLRCAPTISQTGKPPSTTRMAESALETTQDAEAILDGVLCCFKKQTGMEHLDLIVGAQTFVGPEGGCVGSTLPVTVGYMRS